MTDNTDNKGGWRYALKMTVLCILGGTGLYLISDFRAPEVRRLNSQLEESTRLLNGKDKELEEQKAKLEEQRKTLDRARALLEPVIQADKAACEDEGGTVEPSFTAPNKGWLMVRPVVSLHTTALCVVIKTQSRLKKGSDAPLFFKHRAPLFNCHSLQ
jgi:hypothetical protein